MKKQAENIYATTQYTTEGLLNTLNPFSSQIRDSPDPRDAMWYPQFVADMFPHDRQAMAATVFRFGALALLTAGLVGAGRMIKHYSRIHDITTKDSPSEKLKPSISTTYNMDMSDVDDNKDKLTSKEASEKDNKKLPDVAYASWDSLQNITRYAIPVGAIVLGASIGYNVADDVANKRRGKFLEENIDQKAGLLKTLFKKRAIIARGGNANTSQTQNKAVTNESYTKTAKENPANTHEGELFDSDSSFGETVTDAFSKVPPAIGLLLAAVTVATGVGAYQLTKSMDENNIKFKARKAGLAEYAKQKSFATPITILPTNDASFWQDIDKANNPDKKELAQQESHPIVVKDDPRKQPEISMDDFNKPISVTL